MSSETFSDDQNEALIGKVISDYFDRRTAGKAEPVAELLAGHPEFAEELKLHLEMLPDLEPPETKIASLVSQGILQASPDSRCPAILGPYSITGYVGRGGMGVVVKAYDPSLDRAVALKLLRPDLSDDAVALERFTREAKTAARLRHPNIVTVYAVGENCSTRYIAMEYVEGGTLGELIRESGPLDTPEIRRIFGELMAGLRAAHDAGLIHRDIKPSNILLDGAERRVKIADFGLARVLSSQTRMTVPDSTLGTPEYMSPEQARGNQDLDHRTDLYSAGVVLWEMLSGEAPFRADTPLAVIHRILNEEAGSPRDINPKADARLSAVAMRLTAKEAEERYSSSGEVLEALGDGVVTGPRHLRWKRIRKITVSGLACAALFCVAWAVIDWLAADPPIRELRVDPDTRREVHVRRGDATEWKRFWACPRKEACVNDVVAVDLDGRGKQLVVVGSSRPCAEDGSTLIALDAARSEVWRMTLHSKMEWPRVKDLKPYWCVRALHAVNVDGQPGDELVVIATDENNYPCRVSLIDPRKGRILSTFWHDGHLLSLKLIENFFDGARSAILFWGLNNRLDKRGPADRVCWGPPACWDIVSVAGILDPLNMDGWGPPSIEKPTRGRAGVPYAYAFLDLPYDEVIPPATRSNHETDMDTVEPPIPEFAGGINTIEIMQLLPDQNIANGPHIEVTPYLRSPKRKDLRWGVLLLDRDLQIQDIFAIGTPQLTQEASLEFWRKYWRAIVADGKCVGLESD